MSEQQNSLDSSQRAHLEWMFENQPDLVRDLARTGKLQQHLDAKSQQALRLVDRLKQERGMNFEEAFEVALGSVLAPADGPAMQDNAPDPVPWKEQEGIYKRLEQSPT